MSYDNPNRIKYSFKSLNMATEDVYMFRGPQNKRGRVYDYGIEMVVTTISGSTTVGTGPYVSVGTATTTGTYMTQFNFGSVAATESKSMRTKHDGGKAAGQTSISALRVADIAINEEVGLHLVNGDTTTGAGTIFVIVDWED